MRTQRNYESAKVVAIFCYIIFHSNLIRAHKNKNINKNFILQKCTFFQNKDRLQVFKSSSIETRDNKGTKKSKKEKKTNQRKINPFQWNVLMLFPASFVSKESQQNIFLLIPKSGINFDSDGERENLRAG